MFTISDILHEFYSLLVLKLRKETQTTILYSCNIYLLFPINIRQKIIYLLRGQRAKDRVICSFIVHHMKQISPNMVMLHSIFVSCTQQFFCDIRDILRETIYVIRVLLRRRIM